MTGPRSSVSRTGEYAERGEYHRQLSPEWEFYPTYLAKMDGVRRYLSALPSDTRVLDAGCGEGLLVEEFRARLRIEGLDPNYSSEHVTRGSVTALPYESAAFDRALAGDVKRAGKELAALEEACADDDNGCSQFTPYIAVQRLAAAQWLAESGDSERARRLLRWQDARQWVGWLNSLHDVLAAPTYLARARIEETLGDTARARHYYGHYLRRYDQPMPSQAHLVEEARVALARMGTDRSD